MNRLLSICTVAAITPIACAQLLTNGSFESGFAGWTRADMIGSDGTFASQSGTASPVNAFAVPAPTHGSFAAMTDSSAGGSHALYQDFTLPASLPALTTATISFSLYINNGAAAFSIPASGSLDWSLTSQTGAQVLNQHARVDVTTSSADPFSTAPGDVLANLFITSVGSPNSFGYTTITFDATALFQANLGQTLRLRFAQTDNVNFFNMGVDNVSITIPSPAAGAGLLGLLVIGSRRRR